MSNTNALQVFTYGVEPVRTINIDGEVWLVAKDVCNILEIVDYHQAVERLDDDEKGRYKIPTHSRGEQEMTVINESGLYKLTFRSNKPLAKKFTKWVTSEVIPSIMRTEVYETNGHKERMADFPVAMKQAKEIFKTLGLRGKKLAEAMDRLYMNYTGFSAFEKAGVDPNDVPIEAKFDTMSAQSFMDWIFCMSEGRQNGERFVHRQRKNKRQF